jgi:hypothetical protein
MRMPVLAQLLQSLRGATLNLGTLVFEKVAPVSMHPHSRIESHHTFEKGAPLVSSTSWTWLPNSLS